MIINTYKTHFGLVSLLKNDYGIIKDFNKGSYCDINTLLLLKDYINPNKNILEIGGHCGTSSIVYSSYLNDNSKLYVYEPQKIMYNLLCHNIKQNNLENKIIPNNKGLFCYDGFCKMNDFDFASKSSITKRYNEEHDNVCNFGGACLGNNGENINVVTLDNLEYDNIGFIHCDAQGSENFIFSKGTNFIKKHRPVIYYENNYETNNILYHAVANSFPEYTEYSNFNIKAYCMEELGYSKYIDRFNGSIDTLLIP